MYDVYLGGHADTEWRNTFRKLLSSDISVFDPIVDNYHKLDCEAKANLVAQELEAIAKSKVVVFYLSENWQSYFSMIQLGDAVGRGKNVVVCIDSKIESEEKILRYCEFRGVWLVNSIDEMVTATEQFIGQLELCDSDN